MHCLSLFFTFSTPTYTHSKPCNDTYPQSYPNYPQVICNYPLILIHNLLTLIHNFIHKLSTSCALCVDKYARSLLTFLRIRVSFLYWKLDCICNSSLSYFNYRLDSRNRKDVYCVRIIVDLSRDSPRIDYPCDRCANDD